MDNDTRFDCDARCTNAKGLVCTCWCGGVNHGRDAYPAPERGVEAPPNERGRRRGSVEIADMLEDMRV